MAKMTKYVAPTTAIIEQIDDMQLTTALDEFYTSYAWHTIEDRALPDLRDGLKPSQRRTLFGMKLMGLKSSGSTTKSARVTGQICGTLHPHGDMVVYPTLYRMSQDWVMRYPLVIGQGNMGSIQGFPVAAPRYTEIKLSKYGEALLDNVNDKVVPYVPNYDEKEVEPTILPSAFPNLLANGSSGIAVALATKIPSHNLTELSNLISTYINTGGAMTVDEVIKIMPGPDFPTGGVLRGQTGVKNYYETGKGSLVVDGVYKIQEDANGNTTIEITEIPHETSPKDIELEIRELMQTEKIKGINNVEDFTGGNEEAGLGDEVVISIIVYLEKTANPQLIINQLLKQTSLRKTFSVNTTVTRDRRVIQNVPILDLVRDFVEHRRVIFRNRFTAEKDTHEKRVHVLDGYIMALKAIDTAIEIIRAAKSREEARNELISYGIVNTEIQADAVLELKLAALTKLEGDKLSQEREKLQERCAWLADKLSDNQKILALVSEEQVELGRTLGDARRTKIELEYDDLTAEDLIPNDQVVVSLTKDGYIKRLKLDTYRVQRRGGKGVASTHKTQDDAGDVYVANNHDLLLFFTSKGMLYQRKAHEVPEATGRTSKGIHLANLLALDADEKIEATIPIKSLDTDGYVMIVTKNGTIKRTELRDYQTSLRQRGLTAIKLSDGDLVTDVEITDGTKDVFLVTSQGLAVRYGEERVRPTGRATQGVKALELRKDNLGKQDTIVQMLALGADDSPTILVVTEYGFGKRTNSSDYKEKKSRAVKGVSTISDVRFDRNGYIVGAVTVSDEDTLIVLTTRGKLIQLPATQIRNTGRVAIGVKIVDLEDGDTISSIASVVNGMAGEDTEA